VSEASLREEMCWVGTALYQRGLVGATEGNISVRLGEDRLLCTPSGLCKGLLKPHDLVVVDLQGNLIDSDKGRMGFRGGSDTGNSRTPSSEIKMHLGLYKARPDIQAVVHAHPIYASAFAYAGKNLPTAQSPEGHIVLGEVALVPFATPGTDEVPNSIEPFAKDRNTFLLTNHGATVVGNSLMDAFFRMETLERLAQITVLAENMK
jgi:L-fuculose-phosphate aldolase